MNNFVISSISQFRSVLQRQGAIAATAFCVLAGASLFPEAVRAQPAYGSYVGLGAAVGLTEGDEALDESQATSAVIAARYNIIELPISLRAQLLAFSDTTAFVPTVSYDLPLSWQADAYLGAGVALQDSGDPSETSPIGNQTAFVLQPGIDYAFPYSRVVLFGNAIIAFDAYEESGGTAVSLQGGVGLRF